ncbi:putative amidohydrolase [Thermosinus carboxydivorans Nor1]|uniref:Putative amidohydrolase n=1 Tax=Thermosinus carboxydivorans Nor1 TaxID=401526 RepID=A1HP10_9FIRM|nr:hypothetical protein [Thermosinus carboxydivorans]EAX48118.1 putative amidohydrolase [Thermosinus carboxydivorans Nor1]
MVDYVAACVLPAKLLAMTVIDLLAGNAEKAKAIIADFKPLLTKKQYIKLLDGYFAG